MSVPDPNTTKWVPIWNPANDAGAADASYVHTQASAADTWLVTHNLGKYPSVTVIDSGDRVLIPDVIYDDLNSVRVGFAAPTSGKAVFN